MTRNGRSWSPGEYAAGHQERLLLLGGKYAAGRRRLICSDQDVNMLVAPFFLPQERIPVVCSFFTTDYTDGHRLLVFEVEQNCPSARVTPLRPSDTSPDMGGVLKSILSPCKGDERSGGGIETFHHRLHFHRDAPWRVPMGDKREINGDSRSAPCGDKGQ